MLSNLISKSAYQRRSKRSCKAVIYRQYQRSNKTLQHHTHGYTAPSLLFAGRVIVRIEGVSSAGDIFARGVIYIASDGFP